MSCPPNPDNKVIITCTYCNKQSERKRCSLYPGQAVFCNRECYQQYRFDKGSLRYAYVERRAVKYN